MKINEGCYSWHKVGNNLNEDVGRGGGDIWIFKTTSLLLFVL